MGPHSFTHFHLGLAILTAWVGVGSEAAGEWVRLDALATQALPTVMKKVVAHARHAPPLVPEG